MSRHIIKFRINDEVFDLKDFIKDSNSTYDSMFCKNCYFLMTNPYEIDCNHNHILCEYCLKKSQKCPIDNKIISNKILKTNLMSRIEKLKIKCPIDEKCSWENKLFQLEKHI